LLQLICALTGSSIQQKQASCPGLHLHAATWLSVPFAAVAVFAPQKGSNYTQNTLWSYLGLWEDQVPLLDRGQMHHQTMESGRRPTGNRMRSSCGADPVSEQTPIGGLPRRQNSSSWFPQALVASASRTP
jgi:hypothetical protein